MPPLSPADSDGLSRTGCRLSSIKFLMQLNAHWISAASLPHEVHAPISGHVSNGSGVPEGHQRRTATQVLGVVPGG